MLAISFFLGKLKVSYSTMFMKYYTADKQENYVM